MGQDFYHSYFLDESQPTEKRNTSPFCGVLDIYLIAINGLQQYSLYCPETIFTSMWSEERWRICV